jgi:hypothetical protein
MRHWVTLVARLANPKKIHMNQRVNHEPPGFQAGAAALNPRLAHPCHKPARPYVMSFMEADMTRILATLVGALMAGNSIIMVVDPPAWYASVSGMAIHLPTAIAASVTWTQFRAATEGRTS